MSETKEVVKAVIETPVQAAPEGELTDADLQNVAGGMLDNLMATCNISGTANVLSSNVAIELG